MFNFMELNNHHKEDFIPKYKYSRYEYLIFIKDLTMALKYLVMNLFGPNISSSLQIFG